MDLVVMNNWMTGKLFIFMLTRICGLFGGIGKKGFTTLTSTLTSASASVTTSSSSSLTSFARQLNFKNSNYPLTYDNGNNETLKKQNYSRERRVNRIGALFPNPYVLPAQAFVRDFKTNLPLEIINIDPRVFLYDIRPALVHSVTVWYLASKRLGTHHSRSKADKRGSGKKIRMQTKLGRSRAGQIRSPQSRGGGATWGKRPRDYHYKMSRKIRLNALKSVLSAKYEAKELVIVEDDSLKTETGTCNELLNLINSHGWRKPIILDISLATDENLLKSIAKCDSNVKKGLVKCFGVNSYLNAYQVINSGHCIISKRGLLALQEILA